jgi:hypothetical protein
MQKFPTLEEFAQNRRQIRNQIAKVLLEAWGPLQPDPASLLDSLNREILDIVVAFVGTPDWMSHLNRYWHLKHKTVSFFPLSLTGPWVSTPGKYINTLDTCVYVDSGFNSRVISDFKRRVLPLDDLLHFGIYVVNGDQRVLHLFGQDTNVTTVELFYYPIWSSQAVIPRILFIRFYLRSLSGTNVVAVEHCLPSSVTSWWEYTKFDKICRNYKLEVPPWNVRSYLRSKLINARDNKN